MPLYPPGSDSGGPIFGSDFTDVVDETETSTTSATYQDKLTLVTPAWTGRYRLGLNVISRMSVKNKNGWIRIYNVTNAVVEWEGSYQPAAANTEQFPFCGFHYVTLAGVAKTYKLQFRSEDGATTIYVWDAHLDLWRVN